MKKVYILIILALIALAGFTWWGITELQKVTVMFQLSSDVNSLKIIRENQDVRTITQNDSIRLQKGEYTLQTEGEKIGATTQNETIDVNRTIIIDPDYSADYLEQQYRGQADSVQNALVQAFPSQMRQFTIVKATLFKKGEWAGGVITPRNLDSQNPERIYRFVAQRTGDNWKIINKPQPILTKFTFSTVPVDVLKNINLLTYSDEN